MKTSRIVSGTVSLLALSLAMSCSSEPATEEGEEETATTQPEFDILLGDLSRDSNGAHVESLKLVADHDGYENQPYFTADGTSLLYTGIREDGQADIYRYDLVRKTTSPVVVTPESEYSATGLLTGDGYSVVRVEADSAQRLWAFNFDGSNPRLLLEDIQPVGYHAWGDDHTLAMFILGSPNSLQVADISNGTVETIETNIGRSLHRIPGRHAISFVHKVSEDSWVIKALDLDSDTIETLTETRPNSEDYAWTPAGTILMAAGPILWEWQPTDGWRQVADLSTGGVNEVSRLAVNGEGTLIAAVIR